MNFRVKTKQILKILSSVAVLSAIFGFSLKVKAETKPDAYQIIKKQEDLQKGFQSETINGKMLIKNKKGQSKERKFIIKSLEGTSTENSKTLVKITHPVDLKGTGLLTYENEGRDDDQWLYLPSTKKVRRIIGSAKKGRFLGSEFTFEDLAPRKIDDYNYEWVKNEPCGEQTCDVIKASPKKGITSSYGHSLIWVSREKQQTPQMHLFDQKGKLVKKLNFSDFKIPEGRKAYRAYLVSMQNLANQRSTDLMISNISTGGLSETDLSQSALKR